MWMCRFVLKLKRTKSPKLLAIDKVHSKHKNFLLALIYGLFETKMGDSGQSLRLRLQSNILTPIPTPTPVATKLTTPTPVAKKLMTPVPTPTPNCQKTESTTGMTPTPESESPIFDLKTLSQPFL